MTSLASNTSVARTNTLMSMPAISSFSKKMNNGKTYLTYSMVPKSWSRKSAAARISSIDWDLNKNELEFE